MIDKTWAEHYILVAKINDHENHDAVKSAEAFLSANGFILERHKTELLNLDLSDDGHQNAGDEGYEIDETVGFNHWY